jgi:hypothetical protein
MIAILPSRETDSLRIGFLYPFHETLYSWNVSRKLWGNEIFLICLWNLTAGRKKKKKKATRRITLSSDPGG